MKEGDLVLVKVGSSGYVRTVSSVATEEGADHLSYTAVTLSSSVWVPGSTPVSSLQLLKPTNQTALWSQTPYAYGSITSSSGGGGGFVIISTIGTWFLLESVTPAIKKNQDVIIERNGTFSLTTVTSANTVDVTL